MDGDRCSVTRSETTLAVDGQGLYFCFDRKKKVPVLNEANIAVTRGAIYSLLGPSGCGKTTLFKCIIGQRKIQKGSLKVYGRIPGSKGFPIPGRGVGYMPQVNWAISRSTTEFGRHPHCDVVNEQEIAAGKTMVVGNPHITDLGLYFEMTIQEILTYFGSLYGVKRRPINERINFFIDLLDLPEKTRMIKNLSGGQQRRVSFSIALLHKPPLLILDEPTVGVDPVLRQIIWDHLVYLSRKEHLTIIISTHYTEEARQADAVGLMRDGLLLVERNPEDLIKQHGVSTLEAVFLKICQNRNDEEKDPEMRLGPTSVETLNPICAKMTCAVLKEREENELYTITMDSLKCDGVLDGKNGGLDNTTALLSSPSLPEEFGPTNITSELLASLLRFICLSKKNSLRLRRNIFLLLFMIFVPSIQMVIFCLCLGGEPFDLNVAVVNLDEDLNRYGETFLSSIRNRTVNQVKFDNLTAAYESVKHGENWAALYIDPDFSTCLVDRIFEGVEASNDTLWCSMVKVYMDGSNPIIGSTIYIDLIRGYQQMASHLLQKYEKNTLLAEAPVHIVEFVYGSFTTTVLEFLVPALIVAISYLIAIGLTVMSILEEKNLGLFERTFVAGATHGEVLMSYFFVLLTIVFLEVVGMLTCTFLVFDISYKGPLIWIALGLLVVGIGGMTYGLLISTLTDDLATAAILGVSTCFPCIILNGVIWPIEAMPYYLRYFTYGLPLTKIVDSMRSLVARGWTVTDHNVWEGYLICSFWTIFLMSLSLIIFKHKK